MAKNKRIRISRAESEPASNQPAQVGVVVSKIQQVSVDRTPKDVKRLRDSHINAESIYYPNRTRLYDTYSDIELDGHLTGIIGKRIDTVLNKTLKFYKADQHLDKLDDLIQSNEFRTLCWHLLYSKMQGIVGFEFIPGERFAFEVIPRKHVKPERGFIAVNQSDQEGIPYEGVANLWVVGDRKDLGLLLKCGFYALLKKGDISDWAQYIEIFGQPIRIGKYDANDDGTRIQLEDALQNSGSSLALMIPKQVDFEVMDAKTSNGDGQLQERFKNACNNEMSIVILGNTETTSNDNGGSNAKAKEQGKQQLEISKSDLLFLQNLLNTPHFLAILKSYGHDVEGGRFRFDKEFNPYELQARVAVDAQVAELVPVGDDYFYDTYGIPKPDNYAELRKKMDEQQLPAPMGDPADPQQREKAKEQQKTAPRQLPKATKLRGLAAVRMWLADFFVPAPGN